MEGSAIQSNESAELGRMTSDEAQAVIDLWAQRQSQFEDEATMPSTSELAEALNVPESEVAAMLRKVRGEAEATQARLADTTVFLRRPKWLVLGLAVMLFLGLVFSFVMSATGTKETFAPMPPASRTDEAAPMPPPDRWRTSFMRNPSY